MTAMRVLGQHIEIELYDSFDEFEDYEAFFTFLHEADYNDKVDILLNSGGGRCDVGQMLIRALQKTKAFVTVDVVYSSASMAAMLALSGDALILRPGTFLMFHNYSGGIVGKGDEMLQGMAATTKSIKAMAEICFPFLTRSEMNKIESDKDIYLHDDEENLEARIKRHFKIPKAKRGLGI